MKSDPDTLHFTQKLLELTEANWIEAEDFAIFGELVDIPEGAPKVDFYQRLLAIIKRMPEKLLDQEKRDKLLEAGQIYLEQAIEEEERLLDEE